MTSTLSFNPATIGAHLRQLRQSRPLSVPELAAAAGLPTSTVYRVEQGKGMTAHTLFALCRALDASADEVLGLD